MEIKKLIYFFSFICMCVVSNSYAETTVVDLNINKSRGIHSPGKGGKCCVSGSDKLRVSYKSCRNTPNSGNSLLCGQDSILGLFSGNSDGETCGCGGGDLYYAEAGLGRTINYVDGQTQLKRGPAADFFDIFKDETIGKGINLVLGGGYVWQLDYKLLPYASLGLEYSYLPKARIHGEVFVESADEPPAYAYQYDVSRSSLRLLGKANLYKWKRFMPYVSLGLGGTCSQANNYKEKSLTDDERTVPTSFKNLKSYEFSYSMGVGLDYQCTRNFLLSLGYRYDSFGSIKTGSALGLYNKAHLNNQFSTSSVGLTGRYLFN